MQLMSQETDRFWLMLIYSDWCWLALIDADLFWLMLIGADWCRLMQSHWEISEELKYKITNTNLAKVRMEIHKLMLWLLASAQHYGLRGCWLSGGPVFSFHGLRLPTRFISTLVKAIKILSDICNVWYLIKWYSRDFWKYETTFLTFSFIQKVKCSGVVHSVQQQKRLMV